jgi:hypothetical protein
MRKRILILLFIVLAFSLAFTLGSELETVLITDPTINEASGIAASISKPGILYTHNDSGGKNAVFVMDNHGSFKGSYILETVKNRIGRITRLARVPEKSMITSMWEKLATTVAAQNRLCLPLSRARPAQNRQF